MKKVMIITIFLASFLFADIWNKHCVTATLEHSNIQGEYMNATLCASIKNVELSEEPKEQMLEILMPMFYDKTVGKNGLENLKKRLRKEFGSFSIKVTSFHLSTLDSE